MIIKKTFIKLFEVAYKKKKITLKLSGSFGQNVKIC